MGEPRLPGPALLVVAAFSRHLPALDWARSVLENAYGPAALVSPVFEFNQTHYYEGSMGAGLRKRFLAFERLVAAESLAAIKRFTNEAEDELARSGRFPEVRPLNLDPGLLTLGKFLLATTKDQAHRVYLSDGIFAEVTLRFHDKAFEPWPWTYADYRLPEVLSFLGQAREYYRRRSKEIR